MRREKAIIGAVIVVGVALSIFTACKPFYADEPKTYEECITKNMQGVTNTRTRILVEKGCRTQFPRK
ncbi:MAG: hypothetical protein HZA04_09645 [Nitrospinae bacterium]|nr:hypothetical protein [Nitrospinota bacterium]